MDPVVSFFRLEHPVILESGEHPLVLTPLLSLKIIFVFGNMKLDPSDGAVDLVVTSSVMDPIDLDRNGILSGFRRQLHVFRSYEEHHVTVPEGFSGPVLDPERRVLDVKLPIPGHRIHDIDLADETGHEFAVGVFVDAAGVAELFHPAPVDHDDLVGNLDGLVLVTLGSVARARASATRCRWPPDS